VVLSTVTVPLLNIAGEKDHLCFRSQAASNRQDLWMKIF
jgi:hypothetical protein